MLWPWLEKAGAGALGLLETRLGNTEAPHRSTEARSSVVARALLPAPASPGPPRQVVLSKQRPQSFHPPLSTRHGLLSGKRPSTGSGSPSSLPFLILYLQTIPSPSTSIAHTRIIYTTRILQPFIIRLTTLFCFRHRPSLRVFIRIVQRHVVSISREILVLYANAYVSHSHQDIS